MNPQQEQDPKRIAFVSNSLTGAELSGGNRDVSKIYSLLTDHILGSCSLSSPKPIHECQSRFDFERNLISHLVNWKGEDQLILYFSGHGDIREDKYCIKIGKTDSDFLHFENLVNDLTSYSVSRAIIILDTCYSGAATGYKSETDFNKSLYQNKLPLGIAILASSRASEQSAEMPDGSVSIFTNLFCDGIESGLGGQSTPDGLINVADIVKYITTKLESNPQFSGVKQRPVYSINAADRAIWISKNKSKVSKLQNDENIPSIYDELKLLYENTPPEKYPCEDATLNDLDWKNITDFAHEILGEYNSNITKEELLSQLKLFSPITRHGKHFLHQSAVLCFASQPDIFYPQAKILFVVGNPNNKNIKRTKISGPLNKQVQLVLDKMEGVVEKVEYIAEDGKRHSNYDVIRELVSNAVNHRDYELSGSINISILPNEIQIKSPGNFPNDTSWFKFLKNEQAVSCPRNRTISSYLAHLLYFEEMGMGFSTFRQYITLYGPDSIIYEELPGPTTCIRVKRQEIDIHDKATIRSQKYQPLYNGVNPQQVAKENLNAAQTKLDELPTDKIPTPVALPVGSHFPNIRPNPRFVGHEEDLKQLAAWLKGNNAVTIGQVAAFTGMGGIGKTQLAAEFTHRYGQYFAGGVFWLNFDKPELVPSEVASCGDPEDNRPLEIRVKSVLAEWQSDLPRLLIFDSCESLDLLKQWLPPTGGSRVIVTSRQKDIGPDLGIKHLVIETLPRPQSIALLRSFREDLEQNDPGLDAIAQELGDLPLALHMAGNYLRSYRHDITPTEYLEELRKYKSLQHPSLSESKFSPVGHDLDVGKTIAISVKRLGQSDTDRLALQIFVRIAYFMPGVPIPQKILKRSLEKEIKDTLITDSIARLLGLGLVEESKVGNIWMHRLVAQYVQDNLWNTKALVDVEEEISNVASEANQSGYPFRMQDVLAHLRFLADRGLSREDELAARLANELGYYLNTIADYIGARLYLEQALTIRRKLLGEEHLDTATSLSNLGSLMQATGKYASARPYLEQALAIRRKVLGEEHPDTARSLNNLGFLLQAMGEYAVARPYYEQALAINKKVLGEEHPDTARYYNNLGYLLQTMGDNASARLYLERALAIRKKVLGDEHPDTASSLNNLGYLLQAMGDNTSARTYFEQALAINK